MYRIRRHLQFVLLVSFYSVLFITFSVRGQASQVRVIVNDTVATEEISIQQIRRIFSMRQTAWPNNQAITVYVLASQHETHQTFCTKELKLFPYQLDRIWNKLVYSGLGEEPIKVKSEEEMLERVSKKPGAIGYIMHQANADNVKVIRVVKE